MNKQEELIKMIRNITNNDILEYLYTLTRDVVEDFKIFGTPMKGGMNDGK